MDWQLPASRYPHINAPPSHLAGLGPKDQKVPCMPRRSDGILHAHRQKASSPASMDDRVLLDGSVAPGKTRKEDADQYLSVRVDPLRVAGIPADKKAHFRLRP
jgi:hypothetical protein